MLSEAIPVVTDEGREMVNKEVFTPCHKSVATERLAQTEKRFQEVLIIFKRRQERYC